MIFLEFYLQFLDFEETLIGLRRLTLRRSLVSKVVPFCVSCVTVILFLLSAGFAKIVGTDAFSAHMGPLHGNSLVQAFSKRRVHLKTVRSEMTPAEHTRCCCFSVLRCLSTAKVQVLAEVNSLSYKTSSPHRSL